MFAINRRGDGRIKPILGWERRLQVDTFHSYGCMLAAHEHAIPEPRALNHAKNDKLQLLGPTKTHHNPLPSLLLTQISDTPQWPRRSAPSG